MSKFIRAIIYAIITIPLVVTPFTIYPHNFGKVMIFGLLVAVGIILFLFNIFTSKKYESFSSPILFWLLAVGGSMVAASLLGENFIRSLGGVYFRNNGIIIWFYLIGFFTLLGVILKNKIEGRRASIYAVGIGSIVAIIGIIQRFITVWPGLINKSGRIFSTIGNPIFLGAYLLFIFFLSLYLYAGSTLKKEKILLAASIIINLAAIYFIESAGILLGLILGLLVALISFSIKEKSKRLIKLLILFVLIVSVAIGLFIKYQTVLMKSPLAGVLSPLDRIVHMSPKAGTAETRLYAWGMGLKGVRENPWSGFGVANFETVADRFYNPKFLEHSFSETVWDTPHNIFIETASEQGIIGLLIFVGLLAMSFLSLKRNTMFTGSEKSILAGALTAYIAQGFFGINSISSSIMLFFVLALVTGNARRSEHKFIRSKWLMIILIGSVVMVMWSTAIKPLVAAFYLNEAEKQVYIDGELWEENALRVLAYRGLYADDFKLDLSRDILFWDGVDTLPYIDLKKGLLTLIASLEDSAKYFPNHFNYYYYLGQLYQLLGERGEKEYFNKSEQALHRARQLSPDRQAVAFILGKNYFLAGELVKAREELEKIIKKFPNNLDGRLYYGLILSKLGQNEMAADQFILLAKADYKGENSNFLLELGKIIRDSKEYDKLVIFYETLYSFHPKELTILFKLAEAQYLSGRAAEAEATIARLKNESGSFKDIDAAWNLFKTRARR